MQRGRPPMPPGTNGAVHVTRHGSGYLARTRIRDYDGETRYIKRTGRTASDARGRLAMAVRDRHVAYGSIFTPDSRLSEVAEAWWSEFEQTEPSPRTTAVYQARLDRHVIPALANLRMLEIDAVVLNRFLRQNAQSHGAAAAKTNRTLLNNICSFAVRSGAMSRNVVRDINGVRQPKPRHGGRALTIVEARTLRVAIRSDKNACRRDLPDLVDFLLATGLRIGEACALQWTDFDLQVGRVDVGRRMVTRSQREGLFLRESSSAKLRQRSLQLPSWAVAMLRDRELIVQGDLTFPAARGGIRDLSNTAADLREAVTACGFGWVTSHTFRRTVATLMDEGGLSARAAADQLGHAKVSMTLDKYYDRRRGPSGAHLVLDALG